jgi:hypothetical protein
MLDRSHHFAADWRFDALVHAAPGDHCNGNLSEHEPHDGLKAAALRSQAAFASSFGPYLKLDDDLAERRRRNLKLALAFSDYTHQLRQVLRPLKTIDDLRYVLKGFLQITSDIFTQVERHPDFDAVIGEYQSIVLKLDKLAPNEITRLKILTEDLLMIVVASIDRQDVVNDLAVARFKMNSGTVAPFLAEKELVRRYEFQRDAVDVRLSILLRDTATLCKIFRLH